MEKQLQSAQTSRINKSALEYLNQFGYERNLDKFMRIHSPTESNLNEGASKNLHSSCATQVITAIENLNSSCCSNATNGDSFDGSCMRNLFDDEFYSISALKTTRSSKAQREEKPACPGKVHTIKDEFIQINIKQKENDKVLCASFINPQTPEKRLVETKCTQTPESIIKLHKRLEWDSLGDVGYKKSSSTSNISTLERSVLKEIFFDGSVRDHSNKSKVNASESDLKSLQNVQATTPLASSTFVNLPQSRLGMQPKSTQTTFSKLPVMQDQSVQTPVVKSVETQSVYFGSSATPSSFEYFSSPSPTNTLSKVVPSSQQYKHFSNHQLNNTQPFDIGAKQFVNQHNQGIIPIETAICAENFEKRNEINFTTIHESLKTNTNTEDEGTAKAEDGTSTVLNQLSSNSVLASDLDMGVKLLCSLVDAKSLSHKQKRELIKEIVKRISGIDSAASINSANATTSKRSKRYFVSPRLLETNNEKECILHPVSFSSTTKQNILNVDFPTNTKYNANKATNILVQKESKDGQSNNAIIPKSFGRTIINSKENSFEGSTVKKGIAVNTPKTKYRTISMPSATVNNKSATDLMEQTIMCEWLNPMTQSEIEYEQQQNYLKQVSRLETNKLNVSQQTPHKSKINENIVDTERISQLTWVETEIKRLEGLRVLLSSATSKNNSTTSDKIKMDSLSSDKCDSKRKTLISINEHIYDSVIEDKDLAKSKIYEKMISKFDKISLSQSKISDTKIIPIHRNVTTSSSNIKVAHRAKVPTPTHSEVSTESLSCAPSESVGLESVCSLVQQRKREFMEHYKNKRRKQLELLVQQGTSNSPASCQQQHDQGITKSCQLFQQCQHVVSITKKCNKRCCICANTAEKNKKYNDDLKTDICSQFMPVIEIERNNGPSITTAHSTNMTTTTTTSTTTLATTTNTCSTKSSDIVTSKSISTVHNSISKTSSLFGISSDISIPMGTSCSGGTTTVSSTTHQYDDVAGLCAPSYRSVGLQTSDSMHHTQPIYGTKKNVPIAKLAETNINANDVNVRPRNIAYCIEFTTEGHTVTTHINGKSVSDAQTSGTSKTYTKTIFSLQDHLQRSRPKFCAQSKDRKSILNHMQILRAKRKKEMENILENASFTNLDRRLNALPPAATSCIRVFSTREMKALTNKRCKVLPEVLERQQRKKEEHRRRNNRILRDIFNSRLQQRVRSGKISLNHSLTII